eukprot:4359797-Prymnesium_polylepis.2
MEPHIAFDEGPCRMNSQPFAAPLCCLLPAAHRIHPQDAPTATKLQPFAVQTIADPNVPGRQTAHTVPRTVAGQEEAQTLQVNVPPC